MRLPVTQALLFIYFVCAAAIGYKLKFRSFRILSGITLAVFAASTYHYLNSTPEIASQDILIFKSLTTITFLYTFVVFPVFNVAEAIRLREKRILFLAMFSGSMPV